MVYYKQNPYAYGDINLTGIGETAIEQTRDIEISLKFVCERALPTNWKEDFNAIDANFAE